MWKGEKQKNKYERGDKMITNEEMKKVFEFKLLTGKEFMLLTYLNANQFKSIDIKLICYETSLFKHNLLKYLENLKNKGFLKEDSSGVHTTFTPYNFKKTKTKAKKTTKVKKEVDIDIIENSVETISKYFTNQEVNNLFLDFLENRSAIFGKKINTSRSINMLANSLNDFSDEEKLKLIERAITSGHRGIVYASDKNNSKNNKKISKDYWDSL